MKKFLNKKTVDFTVGDTFKYIAVLMALYGVLYGVISYAIDYWDTIVDSSKQVVKMTKTESIVNSESKKKL